MSTLFGLKCDGCGVQLTWPGRMNGRHATRAQMEQVARYRGWQAPDKLGRHLCWNCRSEAGRDQWRKRANIAAGLPAEYGRGTCTCAEVPVGSCCRYGHPGVVQLYPGHPRLKGTEYG